MMAKKEYATDAQLKLMYILVWLLFFGSVIFYIHSTIKIDSLKDEIALMPHYECWNETTTRTLELKMGNGTSPFYFVKDNEQFVCQDGVKYESVFNLIELWIWEDSKTCLITRTEETCIFNKKVVLLGADE